MIDKPLSLREAAEKLRNGALILAPLSGALHIIGDARLDDAMARLRRIKKRGAERGFTILVDSDARINKYVKEVPPIAWDIIDTQVDPLIIVLPAGRQVAPGALGSNGSIAIRMAITDEERDLVRTVNGPVGCTALLTQQGAPAVLPDEALPSALEEVDYILNLPTSTGGTPSRKVPIIGLDLDGSVRIIRE